MLKSISQFLFILFSLGCVVCWQPVQAAETKSAKELAESFPGISEENIQDSPVPGLYQITLGSQVAYVTQDGRYLIKGEVIDLDNNLNLTEASKVDARRALLTGLEQANMIVFAPRPPVKSKYSVTIFTDIDCRYCRTFHRGIEQVNMLGIEVRYMMYPVAGPGTTSWKKAVEVWCAEDRSGAMTAAKSDSLFPVRECDASQVNQQYDLALKLGLRGTPTILTERGDYLGGYMAPDELLRKLELAATTPPGTY
jgi:thiol:disulfide interchange protein DsbC